MTSEVQRSVHLVEIPTASFPLLVPSATVAEVINVPELSPLPFSPQWVLGVLGWRTTAIAVVSIEALLASSAAAPGPRSKVIVFYPLPGRGEREFFGVLSVREPQPHVIDEGSGLIPSPTGVVDSPFVAATVRLREKTLLIPDLDALEAAFYP